jgi:universal stress protein A
VREDGMPTRTILCPTDFSRTAALALELAAALARHGPARLVILHVAQPPVVMYDERGQPLPRAQDYREAAWRQLMNLAIADGLVVERRVAEGEASAAILRSAKALTAELIVLGTHGRTGLERLIVGSVAADVTKRAPCPVALVSCRSAAHRGDLASADATRDRACSPPKPPKLTVEFEHILARGRRE